MPIFYCIYICLYMLIANNNVLGYGSKPQFRERCGGNVIYISKIPLLIDVGGQGGAIWHAGWGEAELEIFK